MLDYWIYIYSIIIYPIIYIFPAYLANAAPVIFGGGAPLDMNMKAGGKRILGDHKTIRGTASGIVAGTLLGAFYSLFPSLSYMLPIAFMLALGAIFGDLLGSFIKRRIGIKSGKSVLVLDQYGFVVFALVFAFWLGHLPEWYGIVFLIVLTGVLHVATNRAAYMLGLKKVPW